VNLLRIDESNRYNCEDCYNRANSANEIAKTSEVELYHGGHTTKIHAVVDGLGNPVYFQLSSGNLHDSTLTVDVLSNMECFFNKIKHFRRVSTRYDKLASSFLAFVYIASIFILCK